MQYLISVLFLLVSLNSSAHNSALNNYVDPVDGQSLSGWHGPMKSLKTKLNPNKNYAIAILHNPVNAFLFQEMHWFRGTVVAAKKKLEQDSHGQLGHFQVAWTCRTGGKRRYGMTGQTGEQSYQGVKMLTKWGYGMSLFFANFTDGYLQSSVGSSDRITTSPTDYGFTWIAFEISNSDCEQGIHYLNEYIKFGAYENFSFVKDPSKLEGGGCTSFAAELLFQFGAFKGTLINAWKTKFGIPKGYLGQPKMSPLPANTELPSFLNQPPYTERKVSLFAMAYLPSFSLKANRIVADIYDSELIIYSLRMMVERAFNEQPGEFPQNFVWPKRKAYGLKWENGRIRSGSRTSYVNVDTRLGPYFKRLNNYINHKNFQLPNFSYEELNGQPGLVFKKAIW